MKETKQKPSMLPGPAVPGCRLVSFRFLCVILCPQAVHKAEGCTVMMLRPPRAFIISPRSGSAMPFVFGIYLLPLASPFLRLSAPRSAIHLIAGWDCICSLSWVTSSGATLLLLDLEERFGYGSFIWDHTG